MVEASRRSTRSASPLDSEKKPFFSESTLVHSEKKPLESESTAHCLERVVSGLLPIGGRLGVD
jgi:hypothetical protein